MKNVKIRVPYGKFRMPDKCYDVRVQVWMFVLCATETRHLPGNHAQNVMAKAL